MTHTVVIGGGVAGLATAALLAHEGHSVTLLERHDRVGGRAGSIEHEGFRFDTGPSWYLMPRVFEHFFELLGTTQEAQLTLRQLDPGYRIFTEPLAGANPHPVTVPRSFAGIEQLFESLEPGSARTLRSYVRSAAHTADMAERFFLYNLFTRWRSLFTRDIVLHLPKLLRLLTTRLQHHINRKFRHPVLRQILGYPAVFLGTDPRRAPALYHLMSALDLAEGVQYPMGGFWGLITRLEALATTHGATIITGATVTGINTEPAGRHEDVRGVTWEDTDGVTHTLTADYVVSAADLHHTETALLPARARSYPERWWQRLQSGPGAVLVMLAVENPLPELEHHSLFFTRDWDHNFDAIFGEHTRIPDPASLYVCKPSATDPDVAPAGHANLFVLIPTPANTTIGAGGVNGSGDPAVEAVADRAIDQIAQWAGIPELRSQILWRHSIGPADFARDYAAWQGGMLGPSHILSQSAMFRAQNVSRRVRGLFYSGASTAPGVGVPMCLISAELVLKHIRHDHSCGPTSPRESP